MFVVSIDAAVANVVLASCDDTLRIDDEGRWIDSRRMLRLEQAPQTNRAQLRQWCLLLVKLKAWWQSKQCGLAPSSIQGLAAIVARLGVSRCWIKPSLLPGSTLVLCELSAARRPESVKATQARVYDH